MRQNKISRKGVTQWGITFLILLGLSISQCTFSTPSPAPTLTFAPSPTPIPVFTSTPSSLATSVIAPTFTSESTPFLYEDNYAEPAEEPAMGESEATTEGYTYTNEPTPYTLPLTNKIQLLPHDGLFIRRNNQFGTKLSEGIKELIEKGVIIDQRAIRFDDFVALSSDQVPSPQSDQSIRVSYGVSAIPLSHKRDERATHYLEIALRAADLAPITYSQEKAPPVNYMFVVDTSGSMVGEKLDTVKSSLGALFSEIKDNDIIGITEFRDQPHTLLKATPKKELTESQFGETISELTAEGGTDINAGLLYGITEMRRFGSNNTINHIFLFSDGNPTSGEIEWLKIRQNVEAEIRGDIRLSTFAFGSDANTRELDALAGMTGGKYTFITDPNDIQFNLQEELNRREYLAGINIQMKIEIDEDIPILYLYGHDQVTDPATRADVLQKVAEAKATATAVGVEAQPDIVTQEKGSRIFVPDLAIGETYWVVFELAIPEERLSSFGKATVQYVDTFARENRNQEIPLSSKGELPADLVAQHALGLWTSEVVFYALDDLYLMDVETAKTRIEQHVAILESANADLSSPQLKDDVITLEKFLVLAQNLGQIRSFSDEPASGAQSFLFFSLNEFGRVRNGFNRVNYSPVR